MLTSGSLRATNQTFEHTPTPPGIALEGPAGASDTIGCDGSHRHSVETLHHPATAPFVSSGPALTEPRSAQSASQESSSRVQDRRRTSRLWQPH